MAINSIFGRAQQFGHDSAGALRGRLKLGTEAKAFGKNDTARTTAGGPMGDIDRVTMKAPSTTSASAKQPFGDINRVTMQAPPQTTSSEKQPLGDIDRVTMLAPSQPFGDIDRVTMLAGNSGVDISA